MSVRYDMQHLQLGLNAQYIMASGTFFIKQLIHNIDIQDILFLLNTVFQFVFADRCEQGSFLSE